MGAWGFRSFENDDAMDWVSELEETRGLKVLKRALREVVDTGDGYLEAPVAAVGLAAAEVVAGLNDAPADDLPEEIENWIEEQRGKSEVDLSPLALEVVERVKSNSELHDQWKDGADFERWLDALKELESRLQGEEDE